MREGGGATLKATNLDFVSSLGRILRHYCLKIAVSKLEYVRTDQNQSFPLSGLGGEDGDAGGNAGQHDTKGHETERTADVGKKDDDSDRCRLAELRPLLDRVDGPVKVGRHPYRDGEADRTDDVVEQIKSSVDSEEGFPLPRCERAETGLCHV